MTVNMCVAEAAHPVTVVVPIYGVERYLDKAVTSIVNQTYRNLQIVLVDDGSKDRCPEMCDEWAAKDDRIQVVHKRNGGLGSARNAGMRVARGDYICFVDSDDYITPNAVELMLGAAVKHDAQMVVFGVRNVRYDDGAYTPLNANVMDLSVASSNAEVKALLPEMMRKYYAIPAWNKLFSLPFLTEHDMWFDESVKVGEDTLFNVPLYTMLDRMVCLPDVLYHYVSRSGSLCNQFNPDWFKDRRTLFERSEATLQEWSPEAVGSFAEEFVFQTGVILDFLYEDDSAETKTVRQLMIAQIASDKSLAHALTLFTPSNKRNALTAKMLGTHNRMLLAMYGRAVAGAKRLKAGKVGK